MSPGLSRRQHQNASQDPVGLPAEQAPARLLGVSPARSGRAPLTSCSLSWAHGEIDTSKLSTSDLDTGQERRPHGAAGDRCHRREAKKQSVCCHPKEQVCWPAGPMEQMALKKAGLPRRGGTTQRAPMERVPSAGEGREQGVGNRDSAPGQGSAAEPESCTPRSPNRTKWTIQQTPLGAAGGPEVPSMGVLGGWIPDAVQSSRVSGMDGLRRPLKPPRPRACRLREV